MPHERQVSPDYSIDHPAIVLKYRIEGSIRTHITRAWRRCDDAMDFYLSRVASGTLRGYDFLETFFQETGKGDKPDFTLPTEVEKQQLIDLIKTLGE